MNRETPAMIKIGVRLEGESKRQQILECKMEEISQGSPHSVKYTEREKIRGRGALVTKRFCNSRDLILQWAWPEELGCKSSCVWYRYSRHMISLSPYRDDRNEGL